MVRLVAGRRVASRVGGRRGSTVVAVVAVVARGGR